MSLAKRISKTGVFSKLPESELQRLAELGKKQKLRSQEYLFHQGDMWPNVLFLMSGKLRWAILDLSGREQVLYWVEPGSLFWGHTMFDGNPMPASLRSVQPSELYIWSYTSLSPLLNRYPESLWEIMKQMVGTMRQAREVIYGLAFTPVAGRIARLLLESLNDPEQTSLDRDLTLNEIASIVSSSQEVVCRLLYQFQADGILEISRAKFDIHDRSALERLAEIDLEAAR
jgi:CRP/FNR family transcriptional regulator, cyclic AMP receptor protein